MAPPLRAVQEGLSHIPMDDHFPGLQDLAQLVLSISMNKDFQAVDARSQIVSRAPVDIDPHIPSLRAEPAPEKALPPGPINNESLPAVEIGTGEKAGRTLFPFGGKGPGVEDQDFLSFAGFSQRLPALPIDPFHRPA